MKRFAEAELLVDSTLEYYSFYDDRVKRKELEYLGLSAAFLDHNFRKAYDYIRSDKSVYIFSILNKICQEIKTWFVYAVFWLIWFIFTMLKTQDPVFSSKNLKMIFFILCF